MCHGAVRSLAGRRGLLHRLTRGRGWQGVAIIAEHLSAAGWSILLVALFIPPDLLLRTASFQLLFAPGRVPRFADTALAMWIGSSVNFLLPVATVGGEFVKARILTLRKVSGVDAAASVVLDKTVQALSVLLWALIGIAILAVVAPPDDPMVTAAFVGAVLLALGIGGFVVAQFAGTFGLLIATIGTDDFTNAYRFTFGSYNLYNGFHIVAMVVGLFAISEVFFQVQSGDYLLKPKIDRIKAPFTSILPTATVPHAAPTASSLSP